MKFAIGQVIIEIKILNFTNLTRSVEFKVDFPLGGQKVQIDGHYTELVDNPFAISVEVWKDESHAEKSLK